MYFTLSSTTTMAALLGVLLAITTPTVVVGKTLIVEWKGVNPSPPTLTIERGDTVIWKNSDKINHSVVETTPGTLTCIEKSGGFRSSIIPPGGTWQRTFVQPTTINYMDAIKDHCYKGSGKGTIIIQAK